MTDNFLLLLIHSDYDKSHWRTTYRKTVLENPPSSMKHYFLIEGSKPCAKEEDTIVIPDTMYRNRNMTPLLFDCVMKALDFSSEWVGFVSDKDYIILSRLIPFLTEDQNFVGYEKDGKGIYFIRASAMREIDTQDNTIGVVEAMKKAGHKLFVPPNIVHPVRVPKTYNPIIACLNLRPDKIERLHKRLANPHIAVLTICIGKYDRFFGGWYESTQEFFLTNCTRHYYVWTDAKYKLPYTDLEYCTVIQQENLGYEKNNWYRFKMFLKLKEELMHYDYIYFSQVTGRCRTYMMESELLPTAEEENFVIARNIDMPDYFTHDEQPNSTACVDKSKARFYAQGGLFGGKPAVFFDMCEVCQAEAEENDRRGVVSWLKDESHLNKYFFYKNPKQTWLRFWWPPTEKQSEKCHYYTLEKKRYGGFLYLRTRDTDEA